MQRFQLSVASNGLSPPGPNVGIILLSADVPPVNNPVYQWVVARKVFKPFKKIGFNRLTKLDFDPLTIGGSSITIQIVVSLLKSITRLDFLYLKSSGCKNVILGHAVFHQCQPAQGILLGSELQTAAHQYPQVTPMVCVETGAYIAWFYPIAEVRLS